MHFVSNVKLLRCNAFALNAYIHLVVAWPAQRNIMLLVRTVQTLFWTCHWFFTGVSEGPVFCFLFTPRAFAVIVRCQTFFCQQSLVYRDVSRLVSTVCHGTASMGTPGTDTLLVPGIVVTVAFPNAGLAITLVSITVLMEFRQGLGGVTVFAVFHSTTAAFLAWYHAALRCLMRSLLASS